MEPHATRGDNGELLVIDSDGWTASFKDGRWHDGVRFSHDVAEFSPVDDQEEVYRLLKGTRRTRRVARRRRTAAAGWRMRSAGRAADTIHRII